MAYLYGKITRAKNVLPWPNDDQRDTLTIYNLLKGISIKEGKGPVKGGLEKYNYK